MDIGAGDIEFVGGDAVGLVEALDDGDVVADRVAEDIDDDVAAGIAREGRKFFGDELFDADVLQADGVEHAGGGLNDARRGMTGHRLERDALGHEAADPFERNNLFKLDAVAEGAAGGDDRVGQFKTGQRHFHVGFHLAAIVLLAGGAHHRSIVIDA